MARMAPEGHFPASLAIPISSCQAARMTAASSFFLVTDIVDIIPFNWSARADRLRNDGSLANRICTGTQPIFLIGSIAASTSCRVAERSLSLQCWTTLLTAPWGSLRNSTIEKIDKEVLIADG